MTVKRNSGRGSSHDFLKTIWTAIGGQRSPQLQEQAFALDPMRAFTRNFCIVEILSHISMEHRKVPIKLALTLVPVFKFLSPDSTSKLARIAKVIEKASHDAVLLFDETVPGIYIVAAGKVGVYPPGATRPLVTLGQGASFGEMSFLEKSKASATIRAAENGTQLILLKQQDLSALVDGDAEVGRAIFRGMAFTLSQKLRTTTDRITAELNAGRALLRSLSDSDNVGSIELIPEDLVQQNEAVLASLDQINKHVGEMIVRNPDKAAALHEIEMLTKDVRQRYAHFFPKLAGHVGAITMFVQSMEEFIMQSTRD